MGQACRAGPRHGTIGPVQTQHGSTARKARPAQPVVSCRAWVATLANRPARPDTHITVSNMFLSSWHDRRTAVAHDGCGEGGDAHGARRMWRRQRLPRCTTDVARQWWNMTEEEVVSATHISRGGGGGGSGTRQRRRRMWWWCTPAVTAFIQMGYMGLPGLSSYLCPDRHGP